MSAIIAVQMYTLRDFTKTREGFSESLAKVSRIGYRAVQLSAVGAMNGERPEVSAAEARALLDEHGLHCVATHRSWDDLLGQTDAEIEFHRTLGCDYVAIGGLPSAYWQQGAEGYRRFSAEAVPVIARLKEAGIRFGYHNHDFEFQRLAAGRTHYDLLIDAEPDLTLEIDVYWAVHAGINPIRLFERCGGRVPVIHVKDKEVVPGDGPVMAAVGEGNLDWDGILPACATAGVEVYAVEQDICRRDPFDCLRSSYEFLRERGVEG